MIIANSAALGAIPPKPSAPPPEPAPMRPGKSAMAVGQLAKQAVAAAREAGIDVPKNAQGLAASQIAKGASAESIFAAQTTDDSTGVDGPQDGEADVIAPVSPDVAAPDPMLPPSDEIALQVMQTAETDRAMQAAAQYEQAGAVMAATGDSSAQIALDLLS